MKRHKRGSKGKRKQEGTDETLWLLQACGSIPLKANNKERRIKEALARVGGRDHQRLSSLANPHRGCEPTTVEAREAFFSL